MQKKIICATVCVLSTCFVSTAHAQANGRNNLSCLSSSTNSVAGTLGELQTVAKEVGVEIRETLQDINDCFTITSKDSPNNAIADISSCVSNSASARAPQVQSLVDEFNTLRPQVEQLQQAIQACSSSSPQNTPTLTRR